MLYSNTICNHDYFFTSYYDSFCVGSRKCHSNTATMQTSCRLSWNAMRLSSILQWYMLNQIVTTINRNLISTASGYPDAVCVPDSCGCSPKYYVGDTEVQCIQSGMFGKREESSNFKPGFTIKYQCPPVHPTHLGICMSTCEQDSDCDASKNEKCCFNGGCGKTCRAGVIPPSWDSSDIHIIELCLNKIFI